MKYMTILKANINGSELNSVSARDLHKSLSIQTKFADWIKRQLDVFVEGEDFLKIEKPKTNNIIEYVLTIETAKHIAMMQKNDAGKKVRNYFIKIEKQFQKDSNLQLDIQFQRLEALTSFAGATKESLDSHNERLLSLEQNVRMESWQERNLMDAKNTKVYELAGDDKAMANKLHRKVWQLFKKRFHLPRYNELKFGQYEDGLMYIESLTLADMVG